MLLHVKPESSAAGSRPAPNGSRAVSLPRGTETILLVEDDEAVRFFTGRILETCGYTVVEARNGREALDVADGLTGAINLLLTDAIMPLMVGGELARSLRVVRPQLKVL